MMIKIYVKSCSKIFIVSNFQSFNAQTKITLKQHLVNGAKIYNFAYGIMIILIVQPDLKTHVIKEFHQIHIIVIMIVF